MRVLFEKWDSFDEKQMKLIHHFLNNELELISGVFDLSPQFVSFSDKITIIVYEDGYDKEMEKYSFGAMANYQFLIKINGTNGLDSFDHEWFHLLDMLLAGNKKKESGLSSLMWAIKDEEMNQCSDLEKSMWELLKVIKNSDFFKRISKIDTESENLRYQLNPMEILARVFETYMGEKKSINYYYSDFYPIKSERKDLFNALEMFFDIISYYDSILFPRKFELS